MSHNILVLILITVSALILAGAVGLFRKKRWPCFDDWWSAEGVPVFLSIWFLLAIIATIVGCNHQV